MLPEGWRQTKLGDLYSFKNGLNAEKSAYGAGTKFVNVMDVFGNDVLTADRVVGSITVSKKQLANATVERGDVLFNRTSETAEEIALSAVYLDDEPITFGGFVIRGRPVSNAVFPEFSMYALQSSSVRREMIRRAQGGIRANIGQGDIAAVSIALPPSQEQIRIADLLKTWGQAIETVDKLIKTARAQKKALMQQLLTGKRRLPGFEGAWELVQIRELMREVKRDFDWDDDQDYRLISVRRRSGGAFLREVLSGHDILTKNMRIAKAGDFLISKMQVLHGASAVVPPELDRCHISGSYIAMVARKPEKFDVRFFDWLSRTKRFYHMTYLCSYGVHIEKMTFNPSLFMREEVLVPPTISEARAIVGVLDAAESEIRSLEAHKVLLSDEKRALMQQLLTGKRRVNVEEPA